MVPRQVSRKVSQSIVKFVLKILFLKGRFYTKRPLFLIDFSIFYAKFAWLIDFNFGRTRWSQTPHPLDQNLTLCAILCAHKFIFNSISNTIPNIVVIPLLIKCFDGPNVLLPVVAPPNYVEYYIIEHNTSNVQ